MLFSGFLSNEHIAKGWFTMSMRELRPGDFFTINRCYHLKLMIADRLFLDEHGVGYLNDAYFYEECSVFVWRGNK